MAEAQVAVEFRVEAADQVEAAVRAVVARAAEVQEAALELVADRGVVLAPVQVLVLARDPAVPVGVLDLAWDPAVPVGARVGDPAGVLPGGFPPIGATTPTPIMLTRLW